MLVLLIEMQILYILNAVLKTVLSVTAIPLLYMHGDVAEHSRPSLGKLVLVVDIV
jgi:hypothetical protein